MQALKEVDSKEVFIINDIDLQIAPSAIQINQEDLLYSWKTLRTSVSTKIATGRGQIRVNCRIYFTNSMLLDLHRLVVEFKQSPFCVIKNRYIRESIVPDWPEWQQMAFTLNSIQIAPLIDSSDTWVCELDLLWFNYLPYSHNLLLREEWSTDWIKLKKGELDSKIKTSIGWSLNKETFKRTPRFSIIDIQNESESFDTKKWSAVRNDYQLESDKTIEEMENLHYGEMFDLLPAPSGMLPSNYVISPKNSKIYIRYINYLQRDAMWKNFGIDVEKDLADDARAFFATEKKDGVLFTHALNSSRVPAKIKQKWLSVMLETNSSIKMHFNLFKQIKMDEALLKPVRDALEFKKKPESVGSRYVLTLPDNSGGPAADSIVVQNGFTKVPEKPDVYARILGGSEETENNKIYMPVALSPYHGVPATVEETLKLVIATGRVKVRTAEDLTRLYLGTSTKRQARFHKGTDLGVSEGTPVFSVLPGTVITVATGSDGTGVKWKWKRDNETGSVKGSAYEDTWTETMLSKNQAVSDSDPFRLANRGMEKVGTFIQAKSDPTVLFFTEFIDGGRYVVIRHNDNSISKYMHLQDISVTLGDPVLGGQQIGTVGRSSVFTQDYLNVAQDIYKTRNVNGYFMSFSPERAIEEDLVEKGKIYPLGSHLHFEFYEYTIDRNTSTVEPLNSNSNQRVLVDPVPGWQAAKNKYLNYLFVDPVVEDIQPADNAQEALEEISRIAHELNKQGWKYYDGNTKVADIWQKAITLDVVNQNNSGPSFKNQTAVLMNVSGGLRHITANIPILSQEYPTQQHLGSIEPIYNVDFAIRDDSEKLDGLSNEGKLLQAMRNLLQLNARTYRLIPDSWCLSTDTFITRLFGSYEIYDYDLQKIDNPTLEEQAKVYLPHLTKRTSIMRSAANTSPENPGVSFLNFEIQQTNPFAQEAILSTSTQKADLEDIRKAILEKVYSMEYLNTTSNAAFISFLIQQTGGNATNVTDPNFGKLTLTNIESIKDRSSFPEIFYSDDKVFIKNGIIDLSQLSTQIDENKYKSNFGDFVYSRSTALPEYVEIQDFHAIASYESSTVTESGRTGFDRSFGPYDTTETTIVIDLSRMLLSTDSESVINLLGVDLAKMIEYSRYLNDIIDSGDRLIAEHSSLISHGNYTGGNGLTKDYVSNKLYSLPFNPQMWRSWQHYLLDVIYNIEGGGNTGLSEVLNDPSWLSWQEDAEINKKLFEINDKVFLSDFRSFGSFKTITPKGLLAEFAKPIATATSDSVFNPFSQLSIVTDKRRATINNLIQEGACEKVATKYLATFNNFTQFNFISDSFSYNSLFDHLLGTDLNPSKPRALENFISTFRQNLYESRYIKSNFDGLFNDGIAFQSKQEQPVELLYLDQFNSNASSQYSSLSAGEAPVANILPEILAGFTKTEILLGKFVWPINDAVEEQKVLYIKDMLAELADKILQDVNAMKILGLLDISSKIQRGNYVHTDAYPDLTLPFHPIFGDSLSVDPDFYIWNIYDDAQAFSKSIQDLITQNINSVIEKSYQSIKTMEQGRPLNPSKMASGIGLVENGSIERPGYDMVLKFAAEATDSGAFGPMGASFNMTQESLVGEQSFFGLLTQLNLKTVSDAANILNAVTGTSTGTGINTSLHSSVANLIGTVPSISVGATESQPGTLYPSRLTKEAYRELKKEVKTIEEMFGVREGYQNANLLKNNSDVSEKMKKSLLDRPDEYSHQFDANYLSKLALDSSKDIVSRRMTLKRAYPTFKLFFVEEDENESVLLNLDDFYSYNAVHSFTCERSKSSPADHLVITLQNVSGVLDGTAHHGIADLDYYTKDIKKKIEPHSSVHSGDIVNKDTNMDQAFSTVILRPGMNVQLRAGYSNDPDMLRVLISGRVVDVQWNKNGDLVELMVQSYGSELIQQVKGNDRSGEAETFNTTHALLGKLMLEPELLHFGRWELGKLYQIGESTDSRLDFYDYNSQYYFDPLYYHFQLKAWGDQSFLHAGLAGTLGLLSNGAFLVQGPLTLSIMKDTKNNFFEQFDKKIVQGVKNWFTEKKVTLFLTPQDDNLYPPHPKDYMQISDFSRHFKNGDYTAIFKDAAYSLSDSLEQNSQRTGETFSDSASRTSAVIAGAGLRWFVPSILVNKKSFPRNYQYQLLSTTIWKTFHEMSLRHPGWAYAARPYGNEYRYTMFFGVPSQRYWSRGASNNFIHRMNELHRFIQKSDYLSQDAFLFEYRKLYGNVFLEEVGEDELVSDELVLDPLRDAFLFEYKKIYGDEFVSDTILNSSKPKWSSNIKQTLTGKALKEYLNGLNFRFTPFRKYHIVSSERNLVWNGIITTENAIYNAVDVTYFTDTSNALDPVNGPVGTTVVKAHSFIPENMLRILPIRWPNCKGYNLALRYGMGELIHQMKQMYRGEIIVLGNPRMDPWDICILTDTYNDMFGPVEIDQIVHTFSHETGFLTEIKPAAIVIGNEISSWPILEAMKTFTIAVQDIENNYANIKASRDSGSLGDFTKWLSGWENKDFSEFLREKNKEVLTAKDGTPISLENLVFNGSQPTDLTKILNTSSSTNSNSSSFNRLVSLNSIPSLLGVTAGISYKTLPKFESPSFSWLIAGPILFLQCLREDSVIVVPLMKNGQPMTAGLSYSDPTMIWSNFRGELRNIIDDTIDGTRNMFTEYYEVGMHIWNNFGKTSMTGE